ncbi:11251_t:CDS:2 [Funneliformis caledonium]|uniref:11251_t:CDS:1 n=1 Tax=Funneliformis caledonium TaxID=1117310 RepID=A0A9N8ZKR7_9GLOM|nr:11251_t:CDS:2 [Funneliformis caledonium]
MVNGPTRTELGLWRSKTDNKTDRKITNFILSALSIWPLRRVEFYFAFFYHSLAVLVVGLGYTDSCSSGD